MPATLFLQSEIQDPYKLYETMLCENPVYWDDTNQLWAIYSYKSCKEILNNDSAYIPAINPNNNDGLNEYALLIAGQFVRLSNDVRHEIAREVAMLLFEKMKTVAINDLAGKLLQNEKDKNEIDWVNSICKKLPVVAVLKSFDFNDEDCDFISGKIEQLVKIMLPTKTQEQVTVINEFSKELYVITEKHLLNTGIYKPIIKTRSEKYKIDTGKIISLCVSNLIGLFIQSYDAGRGILSNSLLQALSNKNLLNNNLTDKEYLKKLVIETLRFDPPVHNTGRIAVDDIVLKNAVIKKGEAIFVVLASANRDPKQFANPTIFDINRANNSEHLTFGIGPHECLAKYFSVSLATETLSYFLERYKKIRLLEKNIVYEPMINARLPKNIWISLS
ncbi:MAG: cytochrome P450 [Parafilimonas sp.]